jgi:hypothetical protein
MDCRVRLETGGFQTGLDHSKTPKWENCPLERLVGLKSYDDLVVAVDVTSLVGKHG